jgi:hypothetical protein
VKRKIFPDGNTSVEEATSPQLHRPLVDTLKGSSYPNMRGWAKNSI